jgi:hypothetical protein
VPRGSSAKGAARVKGDILFAKENIPFETPRERLCIVRLQLEELHALRNQVPA